MSGVIAPFRRLISSAAFAALLVLSPEAGLAQSSFETVTTITPPPAAQPTQRRPRRARTRADDTDVRGTPVLRPAVSADPDDPADSLRPATAAEAGAPVPVDGAERLRGPTQPVDGVFDVRQPPAPVDGANPTVRDYRDPRVRDEFNGRPAGFDPRLFQVEIEPILDRRPRQLFRFSPYEPLGVRMGSFVVLPEVEFGAQWTSNVFSEPNARSDISFDVRPSVRIVSDWSRHAAEFRANGTFSTFQKFDSENARLYTLEARGRIDVTRRTNLGGLISRDVTQESRSALSSTASAVERADIVTDRAAATLNHRFNRLRLQLRGAVADTSYGDVQLASGGVAVSDRDNKQKTAALRASWEFKPTLFAFAEVGLDTRDFSTVASSDGLSRDSDGRRYRVGVSFGNTGEYLRGEISLGYGRQTPDDSRLKAVEGILVDSNLAWRPTRLTSLLFSARTAINDTDVAGSAGAMSYRLGVELQHQWRRNLLLSAGIQRGIQKYSGIDLRETDWITTAGIEYLMNRHVAVFGRYTHTAFRSDEADRDYNADEVRIGVRLRR